MGQWEGSPGGEEPGPLPSAHPASLGRKGKVQAHPLTPRRRARFLWFAPTRSCLLFTQPLASEMPSSLSDFFF